MLKRILLLAVVATMLTVMVGVMAPSLALAAPGGGKGSFESDNAGFRGDDNSNFGELQESIAMQDVPANSARDLNPARKGSFMFSDKDRQPG